MLPWWLFLHKQILDLIRFVIKNVLTNLKNWQLWLYVLAFNWWEPWTLHFLKTEKLVYLNHPCVRSLSNQNVSWFCQHFCILWKFWDWWSYPVVLLDCDQWAEVLYVWWLQKCPSSRLGLVLLCGSAIINIENYGGDAFKKRKDGVVLKLLFPLRASVMTVQL